MHKKFEPAVFSRLSEQPIRSKWIVISVIYFILFEKKHLNVEKN